MIEVVLPNIADGEDKTFPLANRIRKNYRHIRKWAKRTKTNCFRIYDREIASYPVAIDYYDGRYCVHYFSQNRGVEDFEKQVQDGVFKALQMIFQASESDIFWRERSKRKQTRQYEKKGASDEFFPVMEYGVKFYVNLLDYLDTGLFLDHRETRQLVASACKGKSLLNLFAYTCSFSVHAAVCGASFTKSVDMSNTYTSWGKENFLLNGICQKNHPIVRADCLKFLDGEIKNGVKYDTIVIDPPTISRSKKMEQLFDVQVDYVALLSKGLQLLEPGGQIFFSTNSRKFSFDTSLFPKCKVIEISKKTIPLDFHDLKIHSCWKILPE